MTAFYDEPRGVAARAQMLNAVRAQLGHERFTANSMLDLILLIENGVSTMVEQERLDPEDLDEAASNTARFLQELEQLRDGQGLDYFTEQSIYQNRINLCPGFWPFC